MKELPPAKRLMVAADFKPDGSPGPDGRASVWSKVFKLAQALKGTGVTIKVNSGLRASGYSLIDAIHEQGLGVFADLKLNDISETLATDGALLQTARPEFVTAMCASGVDALKALTNALLDTEMLGVTVLTSIKDPESRAIYGCSVEHAVARLARLGAEAGISGLVCSGAEAHALRLAYGDRFTLNTPAIRPTWAKVQGDDQNPARVMTPADAFRAGATRIIVGRPIVQAQNPYDAVMRTIDEIATVMG